jgi:acetyl esterase/lipase
VHAVTTGDDLLVDAPTMLLVAGAAGALGTANALHPPADDGWPSLVTFAAGAVTSEIPLLHGGFHGAVAAGLCARGGLGSWRGRAGLGLTAMACAGAVALHGEARQAGAELEGALVEALGPGYRDGIVYPPRPEEGKEKVSRVPVLLATLGSRRRFLRAENVPYGPHGRRNQLDVWARPDLPEGTRAPVVVQVHGGAWVFGSKTGQAYPLLSHLVERGWICVAVNYRLSPRSTWPDPLVDVKLALAWVRTHIADHGGDPGFVAVTGGSAGGHLSSLVALTANDPVLQPGFEDADTSVQAAVPIYGVYDWTGTQGVRRDMVPFLERRVVKTSIRDGRDVFAQASPIDRVHAGAPPFFLLHGDRDVLAPVEQARRFARQLRARSQAPVAYGEMHGAHHAFDVLSSTRTVHAVQAVERFLGAIYGRHLALTSPTSMALRTNAGDAEADSGLPA